MGRKGPVLAIMHTGCDATTSPLQSAREISVKKCKWCGGTVSKTITPT